jgi:Bacteriophage tail sheath protein
MPNYSSPGVYIEELPATGPIEGVGTSTAGFIGPALMGPLKTPTLVTSWTQFKNTFGDYISIPRCYMANAVEGFFKNGGTLAYIVRVGTARAAFLDLADRVGGNTVHVEAVLEGTGGNAITVQVQDAQIVTAATALRADAPMASGNNNVITLTDPLDAAKFRPGDTVTIQSTPERAVIDRIQGNQLILLTNLLAARAAGTVRIADLVPTQTVFRVDSLAGLEVGSAIRLQQAAVNEFAVVARVQAGFVTLATGLVKTYTMALADMATGIQSFEFNLIVRVTSLPDENFLRLSMDPRHSRYFGKIVSSVSVSVSLADPSSSALPPDNRPAVVAATNLANGAPDMVGSISASDYTDGIDAFIPVQDVNILAVPDRSDATVQQALIAHCEMNNRFAVLDSSRGAALYGPGSVSEQRAGIESSLGYAALYYPWLSITDPQSSTGDPLLVPPSGFLAGIYARVDQQRGVHKAPANEIVTNAQGLERTFAEADMGRLNISGINVIRTFPNRTRPTVWGARTTAPADEAPWRYINVRRLFIYVEESIKEGIRWSIFEPNDLSLWEKLKRTIGEFLNRVWRSGALFGATADQAFYVKCDAELNPPSVRALGQVFVEVGIAPVRPAEFVIIRIGIWDDGSQVSET